MKKNVLFLLIFTLLVMSVSVSATEAIDTSYSCVFGKYDYITKEESTETIVTDYTNVSSASNIMQHSIVMDNGTYVYTEAYMPDEPSSASSLQQSSSITPALPVNPDVVLD